MLDYDKIASQKMVTAIEQGNLLDFQNAIDNDADPNFDPLGSKNSPLLMALSYNHEDMALTLLSKGADINTQNPLGRTPLHIAAGSGLVKFIEEALKRPEIKRIVFDRKNLTAVDFATSAGHDNIVAMIKATVKTPENSIQGKFEDTVKGELAEKPQAVRRKMAFTKKS